jgi:UDP-glucose 4-epimerase
MKDLRASFEGSRCVVFGGAGFLGSHIVDELVRHGADVTAFDLREPLVARDGVATFLGDMTDASAVRRSLEGAQHVFAFAGGSGAVRSLADPLRDLHTSCEAQLVLLEAVREVAPQASVVFPGSRLEYGKVSELPVGEGSPLSGTSPYAIHKIACDNYYRMYAEVHGLHTVVLRIANPYGSHVPGDAARLGYGVLNAFVDRAIAGETIPLWGGGAQLRDFVFVDDVVRATLLAAATEAGWGHAFNVGSGEGVSLRAVAEAVVAEVGTGAVDADAMWPEDAAAVETGDFYFDVTLARELLGWSPVVSLDEGIRCLVAAATLPGGSV